MTVSEKIAHLFRTVRRPDGKPWTLQDVASATGLSVSYIWRLRSGKATNPTKAVLERLSAVFGVPVGYFMDDAPVDPQTSTSTTGKAQAVVEQLLREATDAYRSHDLGRAEQAARQALQHCRAVHDDVMAGRCLSALAHILSAAGRSQEAATAISEALRLLGGPKAGASWLRAVLTLSRIEFLEERFSHAYFHARRALAAIELGEGDDELRLYVLYSVGVTARRVGRPEEAIVYLEQATPLAERLGTPYLADNLMNRGLAYLDAEQPERSLEYLTKALGMYAACRLPKGVAWAQHNIGLAYQKLGRWTEAIESLTKSLGSNEALGDLRIILYNHMELGWSYANVGQREMALRHGQAALALAQEHDWAGDRARAHWHLARALAKLGDMEEAMTHYEAALRLLEELELEAELARVQVEAGDLLMQQGDAVRAAQLYRQAATLVMHAPSLQRYLMATPPMEFHESEIALGWRH
ncbi:tetratricopeptide repeat protein [Geochorda subterranea]|uniref:Tetratricopeptide repeat protein n=1 Tax=Geochorda subterranea TaxID=3109564 RepID=A0ABZ1BP13_9FIRM|nr:tetratricopeptide repeat protein [Limnochorda sp. LNt]WRP14333.1 tetratricopeptide repeat protein [Limnochorda sp. LNt]